jgi:methylmalonyl-CoA/ethylmalonyl-CoA epimerase
VSDGPVPADLAFDHVGIVVESLDEGAAQLARLLPIVAWTRRFDDHGLAVSVCFGRDAGGVIYELIAPLGSDSPATRAAKTKRDCLNQLAYRTGDMDRARERFEAEGAMVLGPARPALAFGGVSVQFLYLPQGFIVELIDDRDFAHDFSSPTPPSAAA